MSVPRLDAVVVGAGIAGLAAAHALQEAGAEVLVLDPSDRPGGVMRTDHVGGYVFESGPNTVQVKAPMLRFLERVRLRDRLRATAPSARRHFLYRGGGLVPVPSSPLGLLGTPLLSARAKLRLLTEPLRRRGPAHGESVAEFVDRRLGPEPTRALVGPFLTGVYAGDERELGAAAVFPGLVEAERRYGSLLLGGLAAALGRRGERGLPGSHSAERGFGPFARALAEGLVEPPALGSRAEIVSRDGAGYRVQVSNQSGGAELLAERLVIAAPAYDAGALLRSLDGDVTAALEGIRYAPLVAAPVGVEAGRTARPIEGFGFLVPREEQLGLLGCLFMSQLFTGRAPEGCELLHCMIGGVRWPEAVDEPDDALHARLAAELERTLGLRDAPPPLRWLRWRRAVPQPGRDHVERMEWVAGRLADQPGIALAGGYVGGVGVADALASGLSAAARVLEARPVS